MRLAINLILILIIAGLVYVLISSIQEPIAFKREKEKRELAVIEKLQVVRQSQELFRAIKGGFAPDFDTLKQVLTTDSFRIIQVFGDPDDPTNTEAITYDTLYRPAFDSIQVLGINLDSLPFVPYSGGARFDMQADTLTYQSTLVNVVEVGVRRNVFMGKYGDPKYAKYNDSYDPSSLMKFGNMNAPNLSGNWER
ncbi:MAG: hypothetical protein GY705_00415 [Bacteroidetes bacterium]|nr:hypothetical protein [Bacteroidota bacterium]